jgi:uncharacterized protein YlzI (FlbEa/FlbD family)
MNTGRKIIARESVDEVVNKTKAYKKEIFGVNKS